MVSPRGPSGDLSSDISCAKHDAPAADSADLAHWWTHPLAARKVAEEWTKLAWYLVQGAYW